MSWGMFVDIIPFYVHPIDLSIHIHSTVFVSPSPFDNSLPCLLYATSNNKRRKHWSLGLEALVAIGRMNEQLKGGGYGMGYMMMMAIVAVSK